MTTTTTPQPPEVKVQVDHRRDGRVTITIKLIGWREDLATDVADIIHRTTVGAVTDWARYIDRPPNQIHSGLIRDRLEATRQIGAVLARKLSEPR